MTYKELETRLLNLEKMVSNLAERTSNRDNEAESSISTVKSETTSNISIIEEAMCDNYAEQAETNATVEEALIEIYELIEGGN